MSRNQVGGNVQADECQDRCNHAAGSSFGNVKSENETRCRGDAADNGPAHDGSRQRREHDARGSRARSLGRRVLIFNFPGRTVGICCARTIITRDRRNLCRMDQFNRLR